MVSVKLTKEPYDFQKEIDAAIEQSMIEANNNISQEAKSNHKYTSRTGNLTNATKSEYTNKTIKSYIDEKIADYGKFIHNGTKFVSPDPFVDNAVGMNQEKIKETIIKNINSNVK